MEENSIKESEQDSIKINQFEKETSFQISKEINLEFEPETFFNICRDAFRCHICKEIITTKFEKYNDYLNINFKCLNNHFGSVDISIFLDIMPSFSILNQKCSKCGKKQENSQLYFFYCKNCEEIFCPLHKNECINLKDDIISLKDLDYVCTIHMKDYIGFCFDCNKNLCEACYNQEKHSQHNKYLFSEKEMSEDEIEKIELFITQCTEINEKLKNQVLSNEHQNHINEEDKIQILNNDLKEKIQTYEYQLIYATKIKYAYNFCRLNHRFNHQIIFNFYELAKNQISFIENKFKEIKSCINNLSTTISIQFLKSKDKKLKQNNENIENQIQINEDNNDNNNLLEDNEEESIIKTADNLIKEHENSLNEQKNKKIDDQNQKYIYEKGEYNGPLKDGLPNGNGTLIFKNGDLYTGEFKNGIIEGEGEYISVNGEVYKGHFIDGERDGKGECKYQRGESYDGSWKKNKKDGKGKYIFSNGDFYQGDFQEDMFDGQGIFFYSNGNKTVGMWKKNKRNGVEFLFNNKGEIFSRSYDNNTLIQEKKIEANYFPKDANNLDNEKYIEVMNNFYQKQTKKK